LILSEDKTINITAPGRICLFGDHQDYLGLPVIACAINRKISLRAYPNTKDVFEISMPNINVDRIIPISETIEALKPRDYFASALRVVRRYGCETSEGYHITISGDIPINSGVSSSSAVVVAWIHFLLKAFGMNQAVSPELIAKLAHEAEVLEHYEPGGKMDQFTISLGNIVYIETGDSFKFKTIGHKLDGLILADSGVQKETLEVLFNAKAKAQKAIEYVCEQVPDFQLDQVQPEEILAYQAFIPKNLQPYFYAAVQNHAITQQALLEFEKETIHFEGIGQLMSQHHAILKDILHITVPKIDMMIEAAMASGANGAKIIGSGGGGSIVVLASPEKTESICKAIMKTGAKAAYPVRVAEGTKSIENV
jgi:galactokinase